MKIDKHIEVVCSTQISLSSMSERSRLAIHRILSRHYRRVGITIVDNQSDLDGLVANSPDLVFLGLKFIPKNPALGRLDPERIWLSDYLDAHGIAYTGSAREAQELELDKSLAKGRVADFGLPTPPFLVAARHTRPAETDITLNYPLFIKPGNRGGGLGIDGDSVVNDFAQLLAKTASIATELDSDSLIEQYLPGREYSVAILKQQDLGRYFVMPIELVAQANPSGARILSGDTKSANSEGILEVPGGAIRQAVNTLALDVFHALGARDYCRIDIRLDAHGAPQFLEANLIPSLIDGYGSFPKACALNIGLGHEQMILSIVRLGLVRSHQNITLEPEPSLPGLNPAFNPLPL